MIKLFIDKDIRVYQGTEAENLISQKNDSIYIENNAILKVDKSRWQDAQHYERKTWMETGLGFSDVFVFSDAYLDEKDVERMVYQIYDTGHPIKLSTSYMNNFLSNFRDVYNIDLHGLYDQEWRHDKYFIGIKNNKS